MALVRKNRLNAYTAFLTSGATICTLLIQLPLGQPANKNTPLIDCALARNLGACETGPAEWPQGTITSKYATSEISLSPEFRLFYEGDDTYQCLALYKGDTCLFERRLTQEGYTQTRHPLFNPSNFGKIDMALATLIIGYAKAEQTFRDLRDFMNAQNTQYI